MNSNFEQCCEQYCNANSIWKKKRRREEKRREREEKRAIGQFASLLKTLNFINQLSISFEFTEHNLYKE